MPRTRREYIQRRLRQANDAIRKAETYLADIAHTMDGQKPQASARIVRLIFNGEALRADLLQWHREVDGGTELGLWQSHEIVTILSNGKTLPAPERR